MDNERKLKWLQGRQSGVGSSDSPVLALGEVFGKTAVDLYISKKETITIERLEAEGDNPNFRRGNTYEPLAIAMFEQQTGIKVYSPMTDDERFETYQVSDPDSPLFADFDGFCEDGWVMEVKSPLQRVCDSFKSQGIREYYMVQSAHLAHCANVCRLPFLPDPEEWLGKIKGTRLVVYEPENVQLQIVELPFDPDLNRVIVSNSKRFWRENVEPGVPPAPESYEQPVVKRGGKSKYTQVEGEAWQKAVDVYKLAKERELVAKVKMDAAKKAIAEVMKTAGEEAVQIGPHKFLFREVAGRKSFDKKALQADFPDLDLEKYQKQGRPFEQFNYYGPKERMQTGDETVDSQVVTVQVELEEFAGRDDMDLEDGIEAFDELRGRADLYAAMLEMELGAIRAGIEKAAEAVTKKLG